MPTHSNSHVAALIAVSLPSIQFDSMSGHVDVRGNVDLMRAEGGGAKVGAKFEGPYALRYVFV
jgi:hypothetical protein